MHTTTNRRDLITFFLAALAGLTVTGASASDVPEPLDDVNNDPVFLQGLMVLGDMKLRRERNCRVEILFKSDGSAVIWILRHNGHDFAVAEDEDGIPLPVSAGLDLRAALDV